MGTQSEHFVATNRMTSSVQGSGELAFVCVPRHEGKLGISLNAANRITNPGESGAVAGLKTWDQIVSIDDIDVRKEQVSAVFNMLPEKENHLLTVLRFHNAPPPPVCVFACASVGGYVVRCLECCVLCSVCCLRVV